LAISLARIASRVSSQESTSSEAPLQARPMAAAIATVVLPMPERAASTQVPSPLPGMTPPRMSRSSDGMPVEIGLGR